MMANFLAYKGSKSGKKITREEARDKIGAAEKKYIQAPKTREDLLSRILEIDARLKEMA